MSTASEMIRQLVGELTDKQTLSVTSTGRWSVLDEEEEEVRGGRVWLTDPLAGKIKKGDRRCKSKVDDPITWHDLGYLWVDTDGEWTIHNGSTGEQIKGGSDLDEILD